ncbi:MAG: 50S ribosomal protein L21 [Thermoguttaceae bacterium]|nr:50S ribosomal protein L21 [Thermoguttaceae bacterium]
MYAIFADGARQYKVEQGETILIDYREGEEAGTELTFDVVYVVRKSDDEVVIGQPVVAGAVVKATVVGEEKGPKLVVQKARRRKTFRKKTGHRQKYTSVKITAIECN